MLNILNYKFLRRYQRGLTLIDEAGSSHHLFGKSSVRVLERFLRDSVLALQALGLGLNPQ